MYVDTNHDVRQTILKSTGRILRSYLQRCSSVYMYQVKDNGDFTFLTHKTVSIVIYRSYSTCGSLVICSFTKVYVCGFDPKHFVFRFLW